MMAQTFSTVTESSHMNYAFSFGKVLVSQRCKNTPAVPLNLLALPYMIFQACAPHTPRERRASRHVGTSPAPATRCMHVTRRWPH